MFFDTIFRKQSKQPAPKTGHPEHDVPVADIPVTDFPSDKLSDSLSILRRELGSSPDIVIRNFQIEFQYEAAIVFLDGLVSMERIETGILSPLTSPSNLSDELASPKDRRAYIQARLTCGQINRATGLNAVMDAILSGNTILLADGLPDAFLINTKGGEFRAIQEPAREFTVKGSREGFVEALEVNVAILRRKIKSPKLRFDLIKLGKMAQTNICVAYLRGIASPDLITEIKRRLKAVAVDAILDSGQIEEFIRDSHCSPFTTIAYSERPDITAAKITEGRAALLIDGTPIVLTMPTLFMEIFQSPDDYNFNFLYATLIRWIRFTGFLLTVFSPALYVALISYHPELIPTPLIIKMAGAAEGTPFPAVIEALGMGVIVELLREAGRWMPGATGTVVTVLGLLVVGQALFYSGLVAPPFVVVVTVTLLASFLVPAQENVNPFLRLFLVVLSGCLGLYGLMLGLIIVYIHLAGLRSFGVPFLAPLSPWNPHDAQDILIRAPWWRLRRRPTLISREDQVRQDSPSRPNPETSVKGT